MKIDFLDFSSVSKNLYKIIPLYKYIKYFIKVII